MVIMATKTEKDHVKRGLRILAKIIARDIYGRCMIGMSKDRNIRKIKKIKEKAKS